MHQTLQTTVFALALAIMIGWVLMIGQGIFIPVFASVISVYILTTVAHGMGRLPLIGPILPLWARHGLAILAFIGVSAVMFSLFTGNIERVVEVAPRYQATLVRFIVQGADLIGVEDEPSWETISRLMRDQVNIQALLGSTVASVTYIGSQIFVIVLYASFLIAERAQLANKINIILPDAERNARFMATVTRINSRIGSYLTMKTLINIALGVISYVIMTIIGIDFAGFWAVLIALFNYVPYVGSMAGVFFPVFLSVAQFGNFSVVLLSLVALTAAQVFIGNIVEPRVMGRSLNLSPFVILVSLTFWYALWGIPGAILAVPLTSVAMIIFAGWPQTWPIAVMLSQSGEPDLDGPAPAEPKPARKAARGAGEVPPQSAARG
ncbi:AI-2E family transporter [Oceanomicrobium pacificus]|uniref:AI-2E family transporter n=1 Tax=Oceanomicrobium pacificus TaxID=2692916 RepID=A0A6B0TNK8_9RHOB|nr:AI-2E family transporter [Oceanomicrobium pacificus]MXU65456.1 AI-2E family transporter [Oceanomicrobium pacificus]